MRTVVTYWVVPRYRKDFIPATIPHVQYLSEQIEDDFELGHRWIVSWSNIYEDSILLPASRPFNLVACFE